LKKFLVSACCASGEGPAARHLSLYCGCQRSDSATIKEINSKLEKLADNKRVFYLDIGEKFLTADGL
jgi:hypothetical protein